MRQVSIEPGRPLLTAEVVAKIIECLKPSIAALLEMYDRKFLHVVVLDPVDGRTILFDGPMVGKVEDYGGKPYADVALRKAALAARTGMNTGDAVSFAAHLMAEGDVIYQGGVNYCGLVVASSGAQAPVDEACSSMIARQLSAWCQVRMQELQAAAKAGGSYTVPLKVAA